VALPVFPSLPGITYPVKYTVQWDTVKHDALSGKRIRISNWTYPIHKYDMPLSFLRRDSVYGSTEDEFAVLIDFINSVQGAAQLWAYNDPNDNSVSNQDFGQGNGTTTSFQLVRSLGGFTEPVFIINGTPSITVAGTPTSSFTVSTYGVVTFNSAPASGAALVWVGGNNPDYYWPVRFDDDTTDLSNFVQNLFDCKSLKFSSEKLP
jgi:hypothetical protein